MSWIPHDQRDTAWYVMKKTYPCRVPLMQITSPDYIKYFGMPESGDERINSQMHGEVIEVRVPISQMAIWYSEDVQVRIPDTKVLKEIYERVNDHIVRWKREMDESLFAGSLHEILDDLIKLDKFAAALFPHAQRHFDKAYVESKFSRHLGGLVSITRDSFFINKPKEKKKEDGEVDKPKHNRLADAFQERKNNISGRRWK